MSPEAATDKSTVISPLSSLPTTATCLTPFRFIVHSLTGASLVPVEDESQWNRPHSYQLPPLSSGKILICISKVFWQLYLVALHLTYPRRQRKDSAHDLSSLFQEFWILQETMPFAAAMTFEQLTIPRASHKL